MILNKLHVFHTCIDFDLLDAGYVVYHPNYLVLCERARNAALMDAGYSFQKLWYEGMALAVIDCHSKYFKPLAFGQKIAILTKLTNSTGTRLSVTQEILDLTSLPENISPNCFNEILFQPAKKDLYFQTDFILAAVTLNPLKGTRIPKELVNALQLGTVD